MCRIAAVMGHTDQSTVEPAVLLDKPLTELGLDSPGWRYEYATARGRISAWNRQALILQGASLYT